MVSTISIKKQVAKKKIMKWISIVPSTVCPNIEEAKKKREVNQNSISFFVCF